MTTRAQISNWFDRGVESGYSHMVIVCDTFDYEDFPVFTNHPEEEGKGYMQRVMEVYRLSDDKEEQLSEDRCFRY